MRNVFGPLGHVLVSVVAFSVSLSPAYGQTSNWTNAAGGNWSVPGNWDSPPAAGGSATTQLGFGLSASYTATNNLAGAFALNSMLFSNTVGTTVTIAPSSGSTLDFTGATPFISMNSAGNALISSPISMSQATLADTTILGAGSGNLTITGAITAPVTVNLVKSITGDLTLSGGGTFRQLSLRGGNTFVNGGTLALTAPTGEFDVTAGLQLGQATGQTVNFTATGAGTIIDVFENTYIGDAVGSTGTMTVTNGAVVNSGMGAQSGRLAPGNSGTGALNITNGGVVNALFLFCARLEGSSGTILVDGPGSQLNLISNVVIPGNFLSGVISICNRGTNGSALISNGGLMTGRTMFIGRGSPAPTQGTVTVAGAGSRIVLGGPEAQNSAGSLTIANGPVTTGLLDILSGGQVFVNTDGAATPAGGNFFSSTAQAGTALGTTNVSGSGSLLQVANQMVLGDAASPANSAIVNVSNGGVVSVGNAAFLFSGATVNVNVGGTFRSGLLVDGTPGNVGNIVTQATGLVEIRGVTGFLGSYGGVISGPGSLLRSGGGGAQILTGANMYSGGTTITGGQLAVVGSIPGGVTVNGGVLSGASLGGSLGRVAGNVVVNSGGVLTGGDGTATNLTGVFSITGSVTLNAGSTLRIGINGTAPGPGATSHDQISLVGGGSMALGAGVAQLSASANVLGLNAGTPITIIDGGAVTGFFADLPNGTQFLIPNAADLTNPFYLTTITYNPTSVVLSNFAPVPEPAFILTVAGMGLAIGHGIRRRVNGRQLSVPANGQNLLEELETKVKS
jgi:hypothetical protein